MNGNKLLLDTNTVLYVLAGDVTIWRKFSEAQPALPNRQAWALQIRPIVSGFLKRDFVTLNAEDDLSTVVNHNPVTDRQV